MRDLLLMRKLPKTFFSFCFFLAVFVYTAQARAQLSDVQTFKEIDYVASAHEDQRLDIYAPVKAGSYPVHIFVHGGAWVIGDKKLARNIGQFYAERGVVLVAINYRLAPDDKHPAQVMDCAAAVKWVADNISRYGGDPERITISGHSAGAHLVALLGTNPVFLQRYGLDYGVLKTVIPVDTASFDLTVPRQGRGKRLVNRAIRKTFGQDRQVLEDASPLLQVPKNKEALPPFKLFVTKNRPEAVRETQALYQALQKAGGQVALFAVSDASHRDMKLQISDPGSIVSREILAAINP